MTVYYVLQHAISGKYLCHWEDMNSECRFCVSVRTKNYGNIFLIQYVDAATHYGDEESARLFREEFREENILCQILKVSYEPKIEAVK